MILRSFASIVFACAFAAGAQAPATPPTPLRVITFDGGWNLPVWAAQRQGFFEAQGVSVQLSYTPNSANLVTGLFDGRYDIALATIDNFVRTRRGRVKRSFRNSRTSSRSGRRQWFSLGYGGARH
jgi:ABC-type nitrate/sulfonate/bicarbonate transport system substrate-binding protein